MENLVNIIFGLLILIFIIIISVGVGIPMYDKFAKATGSVVNYDWTMGKFVYKVYMSKEEIINSLKIMNIKDDLSCTFDFEKATVLITDISKSGSLSLGPRREYFYEIQEYDGFSILKLSVTTIFHERNQICFKLNPFMVSKLNAEIIPFSKYGK